MINEKYFTAIPTNNYAKEIYKSYKENFLNSLKYLISRVNKVFPDESSTILNKIELFSNNKIPSKIFYIYFELLKYIRSNDIKNTEKMLNHLIGAFNDLNSDFRICHIKEEFWENDIISSYESQDVLSGIKTQSMKFNKINNEEIFINIQTRVQEALNLIQIYDVNLFEEIMSHVTSIRVFNGEIIVGASPPKAFGTIYLSASRNKIEDCLYYVENIVHEVSHLNLNILLSFDKLIENNVHELFPAPIRTDLRPMLAVFHATYVLSRMRRIFIKLDSANIETIDHINLKNRIVDTNDRFHKGFNVISQYAKTTKLGEHIKHSLIEAALC